MRQPALPAHGRRQWRRAAVLAWSDFRHEWRISLCLVFALAAVLAPLLVLFGLKSGIVTTMTERLKADPVNRELVLRGHYGLTPHWFAAMADDGEVGFVVPRTRQLSATLTLEAAEGQTVQDVDMVPTAAGDPLVPPGLPTPEGVGQILLSYTVAARLHAAAGTMLLGSAARRRAGQAEAVRISLAVVGVLPESAFGRDAAFVPVDLLVAVEDYRDGRAVPELGVAAGETERPATRLFASARLYARGLDDVAPLADRLRAQSIDVVTRAHEIDTVKAIDRVLTLMFAVLAGIAAVGYLISLAASVWANVDRKRREIALLRLVGLRDGPVIGFPAMQAVLVALGGILVAALAYAQVAALFNHVFSTYLQRDELVCSLRPMHGAVAAGLSLLCALAAAIVGGYRATHIDPAESLREP